MCTCIAMTIALLSGAAEGEREWRFDFGPADIPCPAGYVRVSPETLFGDEQDWGWTEAACIRGFGPRGERASPLLDGVEQSTKADGAPPEFVARVPDGRYVVAFLAQLRRPQLHHVQGWAVELPYRRRPAFAWSELTVDVAGGLLHFSARPQRPHRGWSVNALVVRPSTNELEEPGPRRVLITRTPRAYADIPFERTLEPHWPRALSDEEGITVDNGRMRVLIKRDGCGFIDEVWLDGEQIASAPPDGRGAFADIVRVPAEQGVQEQLWGRGQLAPSKLVIDSVELVRQIWPVVVRITGRFLNGEDVAGYQLELHIPRDHPYVVVHHRYDVQESANAVLLSSLGLCLSVWVDTKHPSLVETRLASPAGPGGWRWHEGDPAPWWRLGGLLQESPLRYRNWKASRPGCRPVITARGERSAGWIELCDWKWGVRAGMPRPEVHHRAPKALCADAEQRSVSLLFWPPLARPLDLRGPRATAVGIEGGRTAFHSAYLWFFHRGLRPEQRLRRLMDADLAAGVLE